MGATKHVVKDGDCLSSLADRYGFRDWRTIYDDPANADLRALRPNPNLLAPGDVVMIPDRESRIESVATTARHTFVARSPSCAVELRFVDARGNPLRNNQVTLTIEGLERIETTNSDGRIRVPIPRGATAGTAVIGDFSWTLALGTLRPVSEDWASTQERLVNLGYACQRSGHLDDATTAAIRAFQHDRNLPESGQLDAPTRAALLGAHGC